MRTDLVQETGIDRFFSGIARLTEEIVDAQAIEARILAITEERLPKRVDEVFLDFADRFEVGLETLYDFLSQESQEKKENGEKPGIYEDISNGFFDFQIHFGKTDYYSSPFGDEALTVYFLTKTASNGFFLVDLGHKKEKECDQNRRCYKGIAITYSPVYKRKLRNFLREEKTGDFQTDIVARNRGGLGPISSADWTIELSVTEFEKALRNTYEKVLRGSLVNTGKISKFVRGYDSFVHLLKYFPEALYQTYVSKHNEKAQVLSRLIESEARE